MTLEDSDDPPAAVYDLPELRVAAAAVTGEPVPGLPLPDETEVER